MLETLGHLTDDKEELATFASDFRLCTHSKGSYEIFLKKCLDSLFNKLVLSDMSHVERAMKMISSMIKDLVIPDHNTAIERARERYRRLCLLCLMMVNVISISENPKKNHIEVAIALIFMLQSHAPFLLSFNETKHYMQERQVFGNFQKQLPLLQQQRGKYPDLNINILISMIGEFANIEHTVAEAQSAQDPDKHVPTIYLRLAAGISRLTEQACNNFLTNEGVFPKPSKFILMAETMLCIYRKVDRNALERLHLFLFLSLWQMDHWYREHFKDGFVRALAQENIHMRYKRRAQPILPPSHGGGTS